MVATYRLKGLGWLAMASVAAISFYLVSSSAAAERKRLEEVDRRIAAASRDIRALETEFDVRANMGQLERWNGDTLALTIPTARQFVGGETQLASLSSRVDIMPVGETRTAALIVPSTPVIAAPVVTAAAAQADANGPAPVVRTAAASGTLPAKPAKPAAIKAVAMLDGSVLSGPAAGTLLGAPRTRR